MATRTTPVVRFTYRPDQPPEIKVEVTRKKLRETLLEVQDALLRHDINGGKRKLTMDRVCNRFGDRNSNSCGTAACLGGWASIFLLGFDPKDYNERNAVENLFSQLAGSFGDRLWGLFYRYHQTDDYNEPAVAATAIQRYLDGKNPWPEGKMPNRMRYRRPHVAKPAKAAKAAKKK